MAFEIWNLGFCIWDFTLVSKIFDEVQKLGLSVDVLEDLADLAVLDELAALARHVVERHDREVLARVALELLEAAAARADHARRDGGAGAQRS